MYKQKCISKNVTEKCTFFTFTHVRQTCFAYNFFLCIFSQLFQRIRNQCEILRFLTPFSIFSKKSKNVFSKCVLDFNFAPIKGSIFFIFKKKSNSLYPIVGVPRKLIHKKTRSKKSRDTVP